MISFIQARVEKIYEQSMVVMVHGIGLLINTPKPMQHKIGTECSLHTHMHWHQEQGPSLFGFATEIERTLFQNLIACDGVGPKLALSILHNCDAATFVQAIAQQNYSLLNTLPGIGKKKAEQLVVNLKDKVTKLIESGAEFNNTAFAELHQISEVLSSLHYSKQEIYAALEYVQKNSSSNQFDGLLRSALAFLSKRA